MSKSNIIIELHNSTVGFIADRISFVNLRKAEKRIVLWIRRSIFYCDESCHIEHDHKAFMFLGSISCAYPQVKRHTRCINELKDQHKFNVEIKWSHVSMSKIKFYLDMVDYFFDTDLSRTIVEYNSFLSTDKIAIYLPSGYIMDNNIVATNNYWNTTDANVINTMIYDKNDNLGVPYYVEYNPILTEPHPNTPVFNP